MKKLFAIVLTLMLALSALPAMATEINWESVEPQVANIEGDFVTFDEISVKMWVPAILQAVELSDEDREAGYIAYFTTADQSAAVGVQYVNVEGMTLEDYAAQVTEVGGTNVQMGTLNGITALTYDLTETDVSAVSFATEAGYILEFAFSPVSDEGFAATAMVMVSSIQAAE